MTNYKTLLDQIERGHNVDQPVCLVTFNYDTLLEDALRQFNLPITGIDDYTENRSLYKVFKLHGSLNWAHEIQTDSPIQMVGNMDTVFAQLIEHWTEIRITERYIFSPNDPAGVARGKPTFPAIAIPVERKSTYECTQHMIDELIALLPRVTKMLVIGWRATEAHFLDLLKQNLKRGVQLYVVAGPKPVNHDPPGEDIKVRIYRALPNNPPASCTVDPGGFTDFMLTGRAAQFLRI